MTLYCATGNAGKLREFRMAAACVEPLPGLSEIPACEETGLTFEENAIFKAEYYGQFSSGFLFADDSGLEVEALAGAPGVYSARYAGEGASDAENNRLLLLNLELQQNRQARFVCVIALVENARLVNTFRGEVEGEILRSPRGAGGFGYDPVFLPLNSLKSLAEMTMAEKNTISHRGIAVKKLVQFLKSDEFVKIQNMNSKS